MAKQKQTSKKITKAPGKGVTGKRYNENCEGCIYDRNEKGGYFCLSCTIMGKYTPHKENMKI